MAAYDTLLQTIDSNIRQNGQNEITGPVLNTVLRNMISALGANMRFVGIANPATAPTIDECPKFYLAFTPGEYSLFFPGGGQPVRYSTGIAILYDAGGTNNWQMFIYKDNVTTTPSFVTDAEITNNEYAGNTIVYVSEVTRSSSGSSITVSKTDTDGAPPQVVAVKQIGGLQSGFQTHSIPLTDTTNATLNISVNWDTIQIGETKAFGLEASLPKSAYNKIGSTPNMSDVYTRLQTAEWGIGYNQSAPPGEEPVFEFDGGRLYSRIGMTGNYTLDLNSWTRSNNQFVCAGAKYVFKVTTGQSMPSLILKTANLDFKNFYFEVIFINETTSQKTINMYPDNFTDYPLYSTDSTNIQIPLPVNTPVAVSLYGVKGGASNMVLSDGYHIIPIIHK